MISSEIIKIIDYKTQINIVDELILGEKVIVQKGSKGYKVNTYKITSEKDKVLLSTDYYKPRDEIVNIGHEE